MSDLSGFVRTHDWRGFECGGFFAVLAFPKGLAYAAKTENYDAGEGVVIRVHVTAIVNDAAMTLGNIESAPPDDADQEDAISDLFRRARALADEHATTILGSALSTTSP